VFPTRFAGFALNGWAFALRTWIAMMAALYVAFWLQLQNAFSAAVCVGILALPTRGQAFEKALYRAGATVIGFLAALVMAGLFNSSRDLFILAFAAWMGVCGYVASFFDGSRAYGAVLSGYTAAIVAFTNIDTPQTTFLAGVDRCAAILVGVLAVMAVNDLFAAPDILPNLSRQLEGAHRRIVAFARRTIADRSMDSIEAGDILKTIVGFRAEIGALRVESAAGRNRANAACAVVAALARQMAATRMLGTVLNELDDDAGSLADALSRLLAKTPAKGETPSLVLDNEGAATPSRLAASAVQEIMTQSQRVESSLNLMRTGGEVVHGPGLPRVFAREASFRNALRLFLAVLIASAVLILSGWPALSNAMTMFAAVAGISATAPSPQTFARNAAIAMPLAIALVGITEFLILDGTDAFSLLALGWAPAIIAAGLLATSGNPRLAPVGTLMLVFMPLIFLPSNPQNYDPQYFLTTAALNVVSIILLVITVAVLLPTTDDCKRTWLLRSLRRDFRRAFAEKRLPYDPDEAAFRDADREYQIESLQQPNLSDDGPDLHSMLDRSELTSAAWSMRLALQQLQQDPEADEEGRAALAAADPIRLSALANRLWAPKEAAAEEDFERRSWAAALSARMAVLIERSPNDIAALRAGF
jgi:uncharacterized membrane protein YccC